MIARGVIVAAVLAVFAGSTGGGRVLAQQSDDHPLARIKKHEQELEKKIETERDRPDKKQHAKKVVNHVEENIRGLGEQIKGAGQEIGAAVKGDQSKSSHHDRGSSTPAPKKRARSSSPPATSSSAPPSGAAGAAGSAGATGAR